MATATTRIPQTAPVTQRGSTMINRIADITPRTAALIAGVSYVLIALLAFYANFFVIEGLIAPGDAAATFENLAGSAFSLRLGLMAFVLVFVLDVVIAWAIHQLFKPLGASLSALAAWFRIVYTVFLGVAAMFLFRALQLVGDADYLAAFDTDQLQAQTMMALDAFNYTWLIGLVAFGIHLILLGTIVLRSGVARKVLGIALAVAGAAYVFDTSAYALFSNYARYENVFLAIVAIPAIIGELAFTFWLLTGARRIAWASTVAEEPPPALLAAQ